MPKNRYPTAREIEGALGRVVAGAIVEDPSAAATISAQAAVRGLPAVALDPFNPRLVYRWLPPSSPGSLAAERAEEALLLPGS